MFVTSFTTQGHLITIDFNFLIFAFKKSEVTGFPVILQVNCQKDVVGSTFEFSEVYF